MRNFIVKHIWLLILVGACGGIAIQSRVINYRDLSPDLKRRVDHTGSFTLPDTMRIDLHALSFFSPATNGASQVTINTDQEAKAFGSSDTLFNEFRLPDGFVAIDSIEIFTITNSTAGDSGSYKFHWKGIGEGEVIGGAYSSALADTVDLGTTAYARKRFVFSGTFSNLAANDLFKFAIVRDGTISDNESADINFVDSSFYVRKLRVTHF